MPFAGYDSFDQCVSANSDKQSPEGFCAALHKKITGQWPGESKNAAPATRKISGVVVFTAGEHTDSAGVTRTWTTAQLDQMVAAFKTEPSSIVALKVGHSSDAFNRRIADALGVPVEVVLGEHGKGQIALGKVVSVTRKGEMLLADFDAVPDPIAQMILDGEFASVSSEIALADDGEPTLTAVALLGAEAPAVPEAVLAGVHVHSLRFQREVPMRDRVGQARALWDKIVALFGAEPSWADRVAAYQRDHQDFALPASVVAALCPSCGEHMRAVGMTALKLHLFQMPEQMKQGLCSSLGPDPGVFTACMAKDLGDFNPGDKQSFCAWLHKECTGIWPGEHKEGAMADDKDKSKFQSEGMTAIALELGLGADAPLADILVAIKALKGGGAAAGEGAPMMAQHKAEFASMQATLKAQAEELAGLRRERRVANYQKMAESWVAIPGKPEEMATQLADIEEKAGKPVADSVVAQYQAANEAGVKAGLLTAVGRSKNTGESADPFEAKVMAFAKEKGLSFQQALVKVSDEDRIGFSEYHARSKRNGGA